MCWLCGAATGYFPHSHSFSYFLRAAHDWTKIEGHSCAKFEEIEAQQADARAILNRFVHYYDRWKANEDANKVVRDKLIENVINKISILREKSHFDMVWLERALQQLFEVSHLCAFSLRKL